MKTVFGVDKDYKAEKLAENVNFTIDLISKLKPTTVKGKYIQNISISTTMGPGIHVDENSIDM